MKQRALCVTFLLSTAFLVSACGRSEPPPFDLAAARKTIDAKNAAFTKAHVASDNATIDRMFTKDAKSFPPDAEPAIGYAAIQALTVQFLKYGITDFREDTTDFYGTADLLVDQGTYTITFGKDHTVEKGKYINVWTREDGEWKIQANMWNSNAPPPGVK